MVVGEFHRCSRWPPSITRGRQRARRGGHEESRWPRREEFIEGTRLPSDDDVPMTLV
jgi:hypothetical protein